MLLFIVALLVYTIGAILLFMIVLQSIRCKSLKACLKLDGAVAFLLIAIVALVLSYFIASTAKIQIESNAIDHYIIGDIEKVEIYEDGEVVDWYYKVLKVDYE